ncbi:hypothetical protein FRC10_005035 [Ceratobasidium sp. 414]|nr:hypothetical protein FRC10_005035 [Ceratobasidium sp. 414]
MDAAQPFAAMAANPTLMQQFAAMLAAQNASQGTNDAVAPNPPPTREEADFHPRSSTLGRSSDPANTADEVESGGSPQRPSSGLSNSNPSNTNQSRSETKSPARHCSPSSPPTVQSILLSPSPAHHTTIVATPPVPTLPLTVPTATGPPALLATTPAPPAAAPARLTAALAHPGAALARPIAAPARLTATLAHLAASPARGNQAGQRYEDCPTSYEKRARKRGGRITRVVNGKEEIVYTPVERLGTQEAKYEHFKTDRHPFCVKHNMSYNPYSTTMSNLKNYKQIPQPPGLQGDLREVVHKYRPKHIADGDSAKWSQYGTTARRKIYDTILKIYPFCHHFRDETNEDNWVINLLGTNYLSHTRAYATAPGESEDDYAANAPAHGAAPRSNTGHNHNKPAPAAAPSPSRSVAPSRPNGGEDDYAASAPAHGTAPRSSTSHGHNKPAPTVAPSSSRSAASSPSNRDNRHADKVVAAEEALAKADDPRASKTAKATNTSRSKGKGKQVEVRPAPKDAADGEESDSGEEALRLALVKPTPPTKGRKRKAAEAEEPEPEPAAKKQKPRPKMRPPPGPEPEPSSTSASSAIPISSDGTINISSSTAVSSDAPDTPAITVPSTGSKVVSTKKVLVPAESAGVKGTRATPRFKKD